jgi:aminobenzoyl-glutamate utilization protein B
MDMYGIANKIAEGAALMTNTSFTSRILGTAWPRHFNKVIAEEMYENINNIGLPDWSENDQKLAIAVQKEVNSSNTSGLATKINKIGSPLSYDISGGSDDIGDISWKVPTVTLRFPSNIPGLQGHHWSNSIAMATPIAHKGANAGAKVLAMTILDFLLKPEKLTQAKDYFENVQKEETEYRPMISENDPPATFLNKDIMEQYKSRLKEFYFDETKYETYLQQLGIDYPVIKD